MVQLIRQRRERTAPGPADHDLPDQVACQRARQHSAWYPQQPGRQLPRTGDVRVIQDGQLSGDPRLQRLQQRRLPGHRRVRCRVAEDLTDRPRQLLSLVTVRGGQLLGSPLGGGRSSLPQRTLLITAQQQRSEFLADGIGE